MDDWITTAEAARLSGYSTYHIRDLIRYGKVRAQKFGAVWQVDRRSLLAYAKSAGELGEKRGPKQSS